MLSERVKFLEGRDQPRVGIIMALFASLDVVQEGIIVLDVSLALGVIEAQGLAILNAPAASLQSADRHTQLR